MKKNDFKMLESIGSVLSKEELRVIIGGEEPYEGTTTVSDHFEHDFGSQNEVEACAKKPIGAGCRTGLIYSGTCLHAGPGGKKICADKRLLE